VVETKPDRKSKKPTTIALKIEYLRKSDKVLSIYYSTYVRGKTPSKVSKMGVEHKRWGLHQRIKRIPVADGGDRWYHSQHDTKAKEDLGMRLKAAPPRRISHLNELGLSRI
jgi:hypothetical protein